VSIFGLPGAAPGGPLEDESSRIAAIAVEICVGRDDGGPGRASQKAE
jgi:hypothetical protein